VVSTWFPTGYKHVRLLPQEPHHNIINDSSSFTGERERAEDEECEAMATQHWCVQARPRYKRETAGFFEPSPSTLTPSFPLLRVLDIDVWGSLTSPGSPSQGLAPPASSMSTSTSGHARTNSEPHSVHSRSGYSRHVYVRFPLRHGQAHTQAPRCRAPHPTDSPTTLSTPA
jgi:hypothetical protein